MKPYRSSTKAKYFPLFHIVVGFHALAILGLILYPPTWQLILLALTYIFLIQGLGISLGFHRCLTHRSFDFKYKFLERALATFGCCGMQMGPIWWCSIHRLHHQSSDTPNDPHNSMRGFWFSHVLWFTHLDPRWKALPKFERYEDKTRDISSDPYYRWLDHHYYAPWLISLIIFYFIGGWTWVFWGGFVPFLYHHHVTWMVNSVSHLWGYRTFKTSPSTDNSTNNWLVGILALGEGWHNNHHAFPSSPRHGFFNWWEFDFTYIVILILEKLRLIHNLKYTESKRVELAKLNPVPAMNKDPNITHSIEINRPYPAVPARLLLRNHGARFYIGRNPTSPFRKRRRTTGTGC